MNLCQKSPTFELELLKCNKSASTCLFFSPFLCSPSSHSYPKPLADVEIFSNMSLFVLSWENGSQCSFSTKPQDLFLLTTRPNNSHGIQAERGKKNASQHEKFRVTSQCDWKLNSSMRFWSTVTFFPFGRVGGLAFICQFFFFSKNLAMFMWGDSLSDTRYVWTNAEPFLLKPVSHIFTQYPVLLQWLLFIRITTISQPFTSTSKSRQGDSAASQPAVQHPIYDLLFL